MNLVVRVQIPHHNVLGLGRISGAGIRRDHGKLNVATFNRAYPVCLVKAKAPPVAVLLPGEFATVLIEYHQLLGGAVLGAAYCGTPDHFLPSIAVYVLEGNVSPAVE